MNLSRFKTILNLMISLSIALPASLTNAAVDVPQTEREKMLYNKGLLVCQSPWVSADRIAYEGYRTAAQDLIRLTPNSRLTDLLEDYWFEQAMNVCFKNNTFKKHSFVIGLLLADFVGKAWGPFQLLVQISMFGVMYSGFVTAYPVIIGSIPMGVKALSFLGSTIASFCMDYYPSKYFEKVEKKYNNYYEKKGLINSEENNIEDRVTTEVSDTRLSEEEIAAANSRKAGMDQLLLKQFNDQISYYENQLNNPQLNAQDRNYILNKIQEIKNKMKSMGLTQ